MFTMMMVDGEDEEDQVLSEHGQRREGVIKLKILSLKRPCGFLFHENIQLLARILVRPS
jgi:hypothetical protein